MPLLRPSFANVLLVISALGFGHLLSFLISDRFSRIDRIAVTLLGGLGLLGTTLFLIGQLRFSKAVVVTTIIVGVGLFGLAIRAGFNRDIQRFRLNRRSLLPACIVGTVLAVTTIAGLAAPTGGENNDAIMYHYVGPKVWLRDRVIRPVPDNELTAFPAIVETNYAVLMLFGGQKAPELFSVVSLLCLLLATAALAARVGLGDDFAWWTVAIVSTMPATYRGAYGGFIDCIYASFLLIALRVGFDSQSWKDYAILGMFCGFTLGTKYTAVTAVPILVACIFLAHATKQISKRPIACGLLVALFISVAVGGPWYLRNWIVLGSPIYPPPSATWLRIFHPRYISAAAIEHLHAYVLLRGHGFGRGLSDLFLLPFRLTFYTSNFHGAGGIGLIPLALGPLGLLTCRKNRFSQVLALFAVLDTLVWFYTDQESRFLIQIYVIAAVFGIAGWLYLHGLKTRLGNVLCYLLLAVSISYGLYMIVSGRMSDLHAAISRSYANQRRKAEEPFAPSFDYINSNPSVLKVLILDPGAPEYYCDKDCFKPIGSWGEEAISNAADISSVLGDLKRLHVSHLADFQESGQGFRLRTDLPGLSLVLAYPNERIYRVK